MSAIAGQVLVRLCYCTFLFGKDKQWYTSRPKTQGRRSLNHRDVHKVSVRACMFVCICVCVYVCLCARAHEWVCCLRSGIPLKHGEAYKWGEFFSHALLNHETNAGKVSGRAMLIYVNSWYANGVWFFFPGIDYRRYFCEWDNSISSFLQNLMAFLSLSLGMKLMEQILQSPRLGDLG
jgi:magnesium-transporting ATPase (P-type)